MTTSRDASSCINFIFVGGNRLTKGGSDVFGIISLAENIRRHQTLNNPLVFWCLASEVEKYQSCFEKKYRTSTPIHQDEILKTENLEEKEHIPHIRIVSIDDYLDNSIKDPEFQAKSDFRLCLEVSKCLKDLVYSKNNIQGYVVFKEIFSLFLLYRGMGNILDTSVRAFHEDKPVRFPDFEGYHCPILLPKADLKSINHQRIFDIWMQYCNPRDRKTAKRGLIHYFNHQKNLGKDEKSLPALHAAAYMSKTIPHMTHSAIKFTLDLEDESIEEFLDRIIFTEQHNISRILSKEYVRLTGIFFRYSDDLFYLEPEKGVLQKIQDIDADELAHFDYHVFEKRKKQSILLKSLIEVPYISDKTIHSIKNTIPSLHGLILGSSYSLEEFLESHDSAWGFSGLEKDQFVNQKFSRDFNLKKIYFRSHVNQDSMKNFSIYTKFALDGLYKELVFSLEYGIDPNHESGDTIGFSLLNAVAMNWEENFSEETENNHKICLQALLARGANPNTVFFQNDFFHNALTILIEKKCIEGIDILLQAGSVDLGLIIDNNSCLMLAVYTKNLEILERLLEAGANPDQKWHGQKKSPLSIAIQHKNWPAVYLLLCHGNDESLDLMAKNKIDRLLSAPYSVSSFPPHYILRSLEEHGYIDGETILKLIKMRQSQKPFFSYYMRDFQPEGSSPYNQDEFDEMKSNLAEEELLVCRKLGYG